MIDINKKHKTRLNCNVKIYEIYPNENKIHGAIFDDGWKIICLSEWDINGKVWEKTESGNDLIEISPYADFKIDDKVLVWDHENEAHKCHFAGISDNGRPMAWDGRRTSFTESTKIAWNYCIKYEEQNDK